MKRISSWKCFHKNTDCRRRSTIMYFQIKTLENSYSSRWHTLQSSRDTKRWASRHFCSTHFRTAQSTFQKLLWSAAKTVVHNSYDHTLVFVEKNKDKDTGRKNCHFCVIIMLDMLVTLGSDNLQNHLDPMTTSNVGTAKRPKNAVWKQYFLWYHHDCANETADTKRKPFWYFFIF